MITIPENRVDGRIFLKGFRWADPSEVDFKKKVKKFRHNYHKPKQWAVELSKRLRDSFSQRSICEKYDNLINSILGDDL